VIAAAISTLVVAAAAHGAFHRNSPLFGRVLGRLPTRERKIALTFDDGPNPIATPRILETLRAENVPATFFLVGRHVERWPAIARQIAADGHAIGNHTYSHHKLHFSSPSFVRMDLTRSTGAITAAIGKRPRYFRAPHGYRNPWVSHIARQLGQTTIGWTLGVWDTDRPGADVIARRVRAGVRPGTILLLHDGDGYDPTGDRTQTADALPQILSDLRNSGYEFVGLST
jgi:peptidoglycan/xylan/chitin deacetylase (PgdA/CDA1 family)